MTRNLLPELLDRPLRQFPNLWSSFFPISIENLFDDGSVGERGDSGRRTRQEKKVFWSQVSHEK
jgi:hypothetical protein